MPPQIALLICILIIVYLFWMDRKNTEGVSRAIWLPFFWMFLSASRTVSQWLKLSPPSFSAEAMLEGNPVDRAVFTALAIAGILILSKRRITWNKLFTQNRWILLYFVFGAVSFVWCDYPYAAFKKWIKAIGTVVMVLVVLTEERPYLAIGVILRRLAFLLLPLSVLFIKYYPELGRGYHLGRPLYTGVGFGKNALGQICLLTGIYFSWNLLLGRRKENASGQRLHYSIYFLIIPMIAWLLHMANSATSLACLIAAIGIFMIGRHPALERKPQMILTIGIASIIFFVAMDYAFDVKNTIISLLGRKPNLTDRVYIWEKYLAMVRNSLVGYGFESFYLSAQLENMDENIRSAHNGYLEMYMNLGIIGVGFVIGWIVSGMKKVYDYLLVDYPAAILRLALIVMVSLYSWTEATFSGISNMRFLLFLAIMSIPGKEKYECMSDKDHTAA